jgi:hypothetical protein
MWSDRVPLKLTNLVFRHPSLTQGTFTPSSFQQSIPGDNIVIIHIGAFGDIGDAGFAVQSSGFFGRAPFCSGSTCF